MTHRCEGSGGTRPPPAGPPAGPRFLIVGLIAMLCAVWSLPAAATRHDGDAGRPGVEQRGADTGERLARRQIPRRTPGPEAAEVDGRIDALVARWRESVRALERARSEMDRLELRLEGMPSGPRAVGDGGQSPARSADPLIGRVHAGGPGVLRIRPRAERLAASPLILERLSVVDAGTAAGRGEQMRLEARYRALQRRLPHLAAEARRLARLREAALQERAEVLDRSGEAERQAAGLARRRAALGRSLLAVDRVEPARARPRTGWRARDPAPAVLGALRKLDGTIAGLAVRAGAPAGEAGAVQPISSEAAAALPVEAPLGVASAHVDLHMWRARRAGLGRGLLSVTPIVAAERGLSLGSGASLELAALDPSRMAAPPSRVPLARAHRPEPPVMPVPGEVLYGIRDRASRGLEPGVMIAAAPRQAVAAPEDGRVVFAGPFKSYGLLLIIEHSREYHTLLWGFSRLDVVNGEGVRAGQVVGVMGAGGGKTPELHVERRRNGRPVNPMSWLAASSSKVRG